MKFQELSRSAPTKVALRMSRPPNLSIFYAPEIEIVTNETVVLSRAPSLCFYWFSESGNFCCNRQLHRNNCAPKLVSEGLDFKNSCSFQHTSGSYAYMLVRYTFYYARLFPSNASTTKVGLRT